MFITYKLIHHIQIRKETPVLKYEEQKIQYTFTSIYLIHMYINIKF